MAKTADEKREYHRNYYIQHKDKMNGSYKNNPEYAAKQRETQHEKYHDPTGEYRLKKLSYYSKQRARVKEILATE